MASAWPAAHQAAVSLTFDDGLDVHLEVVMPLLEAAGLRGTFYVNPGRQADDGPRDRSQLSDEDYKEKWTRQIPGWQAAAARGHEVGNHTVDHPCSCNFDFGDSHLEDMSLSDIAHTIDVATRRLDERSWLHSDAKSMVRPSHSPQMALD